MNLRLLAFALVALVASHAEAAVTFPHIFSDGMVLQQQRPVPIWGWADPGEKVDVTFAGQHKTTRAGADRRWTVQLDPLAVGDVPGELTIGAAKIEDVLVGEVWFCSGQSNMEMCVGTYKTDYRGVENYQSELQSADFPQIRFFQVPHASSGLPAPDVRAAWWKCTPQSAYYTSAVAFFFGRELHRRRHVPVGLINSAWGGSTIQPWTPRAALTAAGFDVETQRLDRNDAAYAAAPHLSSTDWEQQIFALARKAPVPPSPAWIDRPALPPSGHPGIYPAPSSLYNAMVYPVVPYAIRGVLWYQGESNLGDGPLYTKRLEALIQGWRAAWHEGEFPFLYVQIAPYTYRPPWPVKNPTPTMLPVFWAAQKQAQEISNTAMIPTDDVGDLANIHPRQKRQIGERLERAAEALVYSSAENRDNKTISGP